MNSASGSNSLGIGIVLEVGAGGYSEQLRIGGPEVLGRIGSPRPPDLSPGEYVDGARPAAAVKARMRPISAAGKASGSRKARMAMYCAVHSPMPRSERSLATARSNVWLGLKRLGLAATAAASDDSASARAAGIPSDCRLASAILTGIGNVWVSPFP